MFGYLTVNQDELKVKQLREYKAMYCGLCHRLKDAYGFSGQMTLTYDLTFAVLLLSSLYEERPVQSAKRCKVHPVKKQLVLQNKYTAYAADMNVLLAYYKAKDDAADEKGGRGAVLSAIFKRRAKRIEQSYPRQAQVIRHSLAQLHELEMSGSTSIDETAGCFGRLMGEVLAVHEDMWADKLRRLGFFIGKFIYIMDAWEDVKEDVKKGRYNPFRSMYGELSAEEFDKKCLDMMTLMMGEAAREFEMLPCLLDVDILRNILYDGVWNKYRKIRGESNAHEKSI